MRKSFDCVELQHRGAEWVQARLAGMTLEEQVAYWQRRDRDLRGRKAASVPHRKAS